MSSAEIKALLTPPTLNASQKKSTDVLNAQFTSVNDLEELDSTALEAQQRHRELKAKLLSSRSDIDALLTQTRAFAQAHLHDATELSLSRHTLSDELSGLSQELTSALSEDGTNPTILEDLETLSRDFKQLEGVKEYVQIVEHALQLSESAMESIKSATSVTIMSLGPYDSLQQFVATVSTAYAVIGNGYNQQSLHLLAFLTHLRSKTWSVIKGVLASSLLDAAEKLGWPLPVDYFSSPSTHRQAFELAFLKLLNLQSIYQRLHDTQQSPLQSGLYPIETLVKSISLRFKYHFEGTRQTDRLDKPEWYLSHILNLAHEHHLFMDTIIQGLLSKTEFRKRLAWREFVLLLLPLLSRKLRMTVPSLIDRPSLFAHTIYQTLSFDASLTEEGFKLEGTSESSEPKNWEGISEVILGNPVWFDAWLFAEKRFAEDQYHQIISASDAWLISEESGQTIMTTTNSARRLKALLEQVIDRFSPLPSTAQRCLFLISIHLPFLELYHERISSSLDAFETISSAFIRAVPGALSVSLGAGDEARINIDTRHLTTGVEGVQRLCKAMLSAAYIEASLEVWSEDIFFLELWQEMIRNPSLCKGTEISRLLPKAAIVSDDEILRETLFKEVISRYRSLTIRAEDMVVQQVCGEIETALRAHFIASTGISPDADSEGIEIAHTLLGPIALLSSHLTFLRGMLPLNTLTALYRRIASRLAEYISQRHILYRGNLSRQEGKSLGAESELWAETCHSALAGVLGGGRKRVEAPWFRLLQAGRLVAAEGTAWDMVTNSTFGTDSDAEWEEVMLETTGLIEMGREAVSQLLKRRDDCP